ncbi:MAG TPA: sulfotransferase [Tepidisphaeraceae bacterium]|nr:sulfotransferase [Tepidisphaeraceae bacterium]
MIDSPADRPNQTMPLDVEAAHRAALAGDELFKRDKLSESLECYIRAMQLSPGNAAYCFNVGFVAWRLGRREVARQHLERAIALDPGVARFHRSLSQVHFDDGQIPLALLHATRACELAPDEPEIAVALASMLEADGQAQAALKIIQGFVENGPHTNALAMVVARLAPQLGLQEQAIALIQRGLSAQTGNQSREIASLHLLLASLMDSQGQYDQAFAHARQGNGMRGVTYNARKHEQAVNELIGVMTRRLIESLPHARNDNAQPVLIVGMPRSGTTLVEQILCSHPSVHGAGELDSLFWMWQSHFSRPGQLSATLGALSANRVDELSQQYLQRLESLGPSAQRIIDKMPANFLYLGLISLLLPKARIIHCRRDPMDTCLSCFMTDFASGNEYACDLRSLGHYYRQYERLMAHWKSVIDLPMLEIQYEQMVADLPGQSRRLTEFLGLPWDDRCLEFHKTHRFVATASSAQVRKPLYRSSIKRSEHYRQHLAPLRAALGWG